jgi:DNA-binding transcriptional LysR family regulator
LLREVADAESLAAGSQAQPQGQLRICSPVTFGSMRLAPAHAARSIVRRGCGHGPAGRDIARVSAAATADEPGVPA